ncbi:SIS domain-containing protein [Kineococcus sp. SYSU DK001]|uniref:SIS domain-containing protein n=1 Tax=Kineococcus sp. SYSU DK001 TaxID=3383122 RepID=UPI003D7D21F3
MLGIDPTTYRPVVQGAVDLAPQIAQITAAVQDAGYDNLWLIGSGGSYGTMLPWELLVQQRSTLPVRAAIGAELQLVGSPLLGSRSVAVFSSLSGTTSETVAAARYCRERGVTVIGLTGEAGTPLAELSDHVLVNAADNATAAESINLQLLLLVTGLLARRGEFDDWDRLAAELQAMPDLLLAVNADEDARAAEFAESHRDTTYHMLVGAGNLWGQTYNYSMCVLEEMQWLTTTRVHGAEFFHGSLELIEPDTSLILLFGEDRTRPLMDRVLKFADQYCKDVTVLDTASHELPGISPEFRELLSPIVSGVMCTRQSKHLERVREHSLDLRRYYRVVEY